MNYCVFVNRLAGSTHAVFAILLLAIMLTGCTSNAVKQGAFESIAYEKSGGIAGINEQLRIDPPRWCPCPLLARGIQLPAPSL
jgi:hypothetical protein